MVVLVFSVAPIFTAPAELLMIEAFAASKLPTATVVADFPASWAESLLLVPLRAVCSSAVRAPFVPPILPLFTCSPAESASRISLLPSSFVAESTWPAATYMTLPARPRAPPAAVKAYCVTVLLSSARISMLFFAYRLLPSTTVRTFPSSVFTPTDAPAAITPPATAPMLESMFDEFSAFMTMLSARFAAVPSELFLTETVTSFCM
ncbi:MAG: hypothetical protein BWY66_00275 [bacterium ADurb.Bin374]|nr:MAG: hypothetical protein BWY66_00275 [bacterium ADurb.Bin374]